MSARIPVFFDRPLKAEWIDYALEQYVRSSDAESHSQALRAYLQDEIRSPETLRKTVRQLQRYVGHLSRLPREQLVDAHDEMSRLAPAARAAVRLRLLREANSFFADCISAVQKLDALGVSGIQVRQLYDRLSAKYGERGTIPRRVRAALETLSHLQVMENRERKWFVRNSALLDGK